MLKSTSFSVSITTQFLNSRGVLCL